MKFNKSLLFFMVLFTIKSFSQETAINWKSGLTLHTPENGFKMKIGGRIQYDHAFFSQNNELEKATSPLEIENGTKFRRVWLSNVGTLYNNIDFGLFVSFEGGKVGLRGAYIGIKDIPFLGNVRVGQLKEPIRLEVSTSSKHLLFLERSFDVDYAPIFNNGLLITKDFLNKRLSHQFGFFRNADLNKANDLQANNGFNITERITGLALKNESSFLHLGASFSYRKPSNNEYSIASKPEAHITNEKYIDTGIITDVKNSNMYNLEFLYAKNSFTLQAEYLNTNVRRTENSLEKNLEFQTYYSQISYCLTGEKRTYKSSLAGVDHVKPIKNFDGKNGYGAFEIAAKYATSDLNSQNVKGGKENNMTLGLNWYLNPLTKVQFNQVWANIVDQGKLSIFQVRFQVCF